MARFGGSRYLSCFYCGKRSGLKFDGTVTDFLCMYCDATNYLDEVRFRISLRFYISALEAANTTFRMAKSQILLLRRSERLPLHSSPCPSQSHRQPTMYSAQNA